MNTNSNNRFENDLLDTPILPDSILPAVEKTIRRNRIVKRSIWAGALALLLTVGISTYTLRDFSQSPTVVSSESIATISDQQLINDLEREFKFLNGTNIDDEIDAYAFVDLNMF